MANALRGEQVLTIGGKSYVLKFGAGFVRLMEESYKRPDGMPRNLLELLSGKVPVSLILRAVWCALQVSYADVFPDIEALEAQLDLRQIVSYADVVKKGIRIALGAAEEELPPGPHGAAAVLEVVAAEDSASRSA